MKKSREFAINVENISKCYRLGSKDVLKNDNIGSAVFGFLKNPLRNYRKHRSLYRFDEINDNSSPDSSDILWALKDVSFNVRHGEVIGIVGKNGAGKSTILKVLCRITNPTHGRALVNGRVSSLLEVGTGFHPELTGRENVYLNGTILGMKKKEVEHKFDEIVAFSGVEKFIDTPVKRYSSGMKVRLAFSVAAHLEPDIMIIDEVLAVGDADFQQKCINKMEDVGQQGRTVLFVSHNMQAVSRLCDRAVWLDNGKFVEEGKADKIVSSYMCSGTGIMSFREWNEPEKSPGGKVARLRKVRILTAEGELSDSFDIRKAIKLEMEFDVLDSGHKLLPHFTIMNERGQCAFTTVDQTPEWRGVPRPTGKYIASATIPGNYLAEGMIYVHASLITLDPDIVQFMERNVVAFNVADSLEGDTARGGYAKKMSGIVRPMLQWETIVQN